MKEFETREKVCVYNAVRYVINIDKPLKDFALDYLAINNNVQHHSEFISCGTIQGTNLVEVFAFADYKEQCTMFLEQFGEMRTIEDAVCFQTVIDICRNIYNDEVFEDNSVLCFTAEAV